MSKKNFRSRQNPRSSADYPTWAEASNRRSFLAGMGKAAAGGILASLLWGCGENRAVGKNPDGGAPNPPLHDGGAAPQPDVTHREPDLHFVDGVPRQPDVYQPPLPGDGGSPEFFGGVADQAPTPIDMPQVSEGLPPQPDVYQPLPPTHDAGGAPMPDLPWAKPDAAMPRK